MTNFYDYWLKLSKWNSEQAALLFNGKDPRIDKNRVTFPTENDDFSGVKPGTWQWEALEYYFLFEAGDWEGCIGGGTGSPKEASPFEFIHMAMQRGINIPKELYEAYGEHIRNIPPISSTSFSVLAWGGPRKTVDGDQSKDKNNHSSSLAVFRAMKDLEFIGMIISVDPDRHKITITAQEQTASAGFHEFGFLQKNTTILNSAGRIFLQLANNIYNHSEKGSSRALTNLSRLLKTVLDTQATPFLKGVPQFQLSVPKLDEAKQRALGKTFSYDDKIGVPSADDYLKNDYDANPEYPFTPDGDESEY